MADQATCIHLSVHNVTTSSENIEKVSNKFLRFFRAFLMYNFRLVMLLFIFDKHADYDVFIAENYRVYIPIKFSATIYLKKSL